MLLFSVFCLGRESIFDIFSDDVKRQKKAVNKINESILRVRNYRETLPDTCYEQALELFLTEYPNSEMQNVIHLDM